MSDKFTEGTRLTVTWDKSIMPMKEMEHELKVLFARYGLEFYAGGSDLVGYSRQLVFEVPAKKVQHRVTIHWPGLAHVNLRGEFERLLREHGYTCTVEARAADDEDFELVFQQAV